MAELAGKVALVTGGGSGLGRAIVRRFVREGARVGILERSEAGVAELRSEFRSEEVLVHHGDVRSASDNKAALDETLAAFGRLDVFVGNAGIYDNRANLSSFAAEQISPAFDELFSVNVKGYLLGARTALDALAINRGGIIFTASISGTCAGFGGVLYVASKHAIVGLTRQLAWELGPHGIRVNAVAPGYVPTQLTGLESLSQGRSASGPAPGNLPLGVIATADDYAGCYVLLASEAGARIASGTVLDVDGGLAVAGPAFRGWPSQ
jgi:NAD(P)-dependent dehydrogenase (short-subunit alcohol dehydrogenase family)